MRKSTLSDKAGRGRGRERKRMGGMNMPEIVNLADWRASKEPPMPSAKIFDLRPRLPIKKSQRAQQRNVTYENKLALRHYSGERLSQREIDYLAMILDARAAEKLRRGS